MAKKAYLAKMGDLANQVMLALQVVQACAANQVNMVPQVIRYKANLVLPAKTAVEVIPDSLVNLVCQEDRENICAMAAHARLVLSARLDHVAIPASSVKTVTQVALECQVCLVFLVKMLPSVTARRHMAMLVKMEILD